MNDIEFKQVDAAADILRQLERLMRGLGAEVASGQVSYAGVLGAQVACHRAMTDVADLLADVAIRLAELERAND